MKRTTKLVSAALAAATLLGFLPATAAQARTSVTVAWHDAGWRDGRHRDGRAERRYDHRDWRRDHRRSWDRDRDGIPNRYDRWDNRRGWSAHDRHRYRDGRRCWTQWRYDRRHNERVRVRVCR